MEKALKLSQVIETMEFGEVAVKISGYEGGRFLDTGMYIYFDENDQGALKNNEGTKVTPAKPIVKEREGTRFIIMSREDYNKTKNL